MKKCELRQEELSVRVLEVCGNCKNWISETDCDYSGFDLMRGGCLLQYDELKKEKDDTGKYSFDKIKMTLGSDECWMPKGSLHPRTTIRYYDLVDLEEYQELSRQREQWGDK